MKLVSTLSLFGLGLVGAAAVAISQGCSSSSPAPTTTSTLGQPPAKPSAPATTSTTEHNFALKTLFLGDTDRSGAKSSTAWKKYGFNIDGKVSTKTSTDVCTPVPLAHKDEQIDGENGIDNAFGEIIVPFILSLAPTASATLNMSIASGAFTVMIDTVGLTDDPKQTNTGLSGQLFAGGNLANPTFTTADKWPVTPALLADGTTVKGGSKVKFGDAFVVNGTWVNGTGADVTLSLSFSGQTLAINIHRATIVFDHNGGVAQNGTIAGVIQTEELVTGIKSVAGHISSSLCGGALLQSLSDQIRQASDIMQDGSNAAGATCDGISIGIGFTAEEIAPPSTVADLPAATGDMCSDAGVGDATTGTDSGAPADAATGG